MSGGWYSLNRRAPVAPRARPRIHAPSLRGDVRGRAGGLSAGLSADLTFGLTIGLTACAKTRVPHVVTTRLMAVKLRSKVLAQVGVCWRFVMRRHRSTQASSMPGMRLKSSRPQVPMMSWVC
jgi:hypothetical protein